MSLSEIALYIEQALKDLKLTRATMVQYLKTEKGKKLMFSVQQDNGTIKNFVITVEESAD